MIPATEPYYASFMFTTTDRAGGERGHRDYRRVLAWDDDGRALIAPDKGGRLIPAENARNFDGLCETAPVSPVTALIPAGGWRIEYTYDKDGSTSSEPLVGWALREDGSVVPLTTDSDGSVDDMELFGGKFRIYHPEERQGQHDGPDAG